MERGLARGRVARIHSFCSAFLSYSSTQTLRPTDADSSHLPPASASFPPSTPPPLFRSRRALLIPVLTFRKTPTPRRGLPAGSR